MSSIDGLNSNKIRVDNINTHKEIFKPSINDNLIEWFVGLCEAESNFLIRVRKNEKKRSSGF
jgi:hypothetical protein